MAASDRCSRCRDAPRPAEPRSDIAAELAIREIADVADGNRRVWPRPGTNIYDASPWGAYEIRRGLKVRHAVVTADGEDSRSFRVRSAARDQPDSFTSRATRC